MSKIEIIQQSYFYKFISRWQRNRIVKILILLLLLFIAIAFRIIQFKYINADIHNFLVPWFEYLLDNGGLLAIEDLSYAYSPAYLYLLIAAKPLTKFLSTVEVIKLVLVCFDFLSAYYIFKIIKLKHPLGIFKWIGFFCVIFAPTVFINSAYWGQCDGIYSSFLVMSVYYILRKKMAISMIFFAISMVFKVQALLLAPLLAVLFFRRNLSWKNLVLIPVTYIIWMLPAFIYGYPILGSILMTLDQSSTYSGLTMNAPNMYVFISNIHYGKIAPIGWLFSLLFCGFIVFRMIESNVELTNSRIIFFIVLIATLMPFILPKMHERYFYPAALFSIALPFYMSSFRLVPLVLQTTSVLSYTSFLQNREILPLYIPAIMNGVLIFILLRLFFATYPKIHFLEIES